MLESNANADGHLKLLFRNPDEGSQMLAIAAVIACSLAALDAAALVDLVGERVVVAVVIAVQLS